MSSNIQEFFRIIFFLIIPGLFLMISDQVKKNFVWSAIISNIQQCFRNIFFLDNCWLFMAIIRKLISFAVSDQKKELGGSKSKSDWVSFSDAKVLHFNLTDAHVCSCLLIWSGRDERALVW